MKKLEVVYKKGIKVLNWIYRVFYDNKYNDNFCVIDISYTLFESKYCILVYLEKVILDFIR